MPFSTDPFFSLLFIDDEPALLEIGKIYLERTGDIAVTTAGGVEEAIRLIGDNRFDAIISDYQMPGMDGIAFLKHLRQSGNTIPFIIFTGKGREEVVIEALNNGADFYVQKGGNPKAQFAELRNAVENAIQRKQTEAALRESAGTFRALVEQSNEGIVITDFTGTVLFANQRAFEIIDLDETKHDTKAPLNILDYLDSPDDRERAILDLAEVAGGFDSFLVNYTIRTLTGGKKNLECIGKFIEYKHSPALLLSIRDVTEQMLAQKALRSSEVWFSTLFKDNPIILTLVSASDGVFVDVNQMFQNVNGYTREEVIGKTAEEIGIFIDRNESAAFTSALQRDGCVSGMELRTRSKRGEEYICRFYSRLIIMDNAPYILSSIENITSMKAAEMALGTLLSSMVGTTGMKSLERMVKSVSEWLGADCVMIGEIKPNQETVFVLSMVLDGEVIPGYSFTIQGTPCEAVLEKGFIFYPDNLPELFPGCSTIWKEPFRGCAATPLLSGENVVIGFLCILKRDQLHLPISAKETLDILAAKASAEIGRLHALSELSDSEEKFRTLVDDILDGIVIISPDGTILFTNPSAGTVLDEEHYRELIGRANIIDYIAPGSRDDAISNIQKMASGDDDFLAEYLVSTSDDQEIWVEAIGKSITFEGARAIILSVRDITKRKQTEQALHDELVRRRILVDQSRDGIVLLDENGRAIETNTRFADMLGYSVDEVQQLHVWDWDDQSTAAQLHEMIQTIDEAGDHFETVHRRKDGSTIEVEISTNAAFFSNKKLIFCIVRDISQRKKAESALRESEQKFRSLVENAFDGVLITDFSGTILFGNSAVARTIDLSDPSEAIGKNVLDYIALTSRELVLKDFSMIQAGHDGYISEYHVITAKGREIIVQSVGKVISYEGKPADLISLRDVTEEKLAKDALTKTNKKLNLLSSITRHDILNQIMIVAGYLSFIERDIESPKQKERMQSVNHAVTMIQHQIEFTREYEQLGVKAPLWISVKNTIDMIREDRIPIHCECLEFSIFADSMLERVFANLLQNTLLHAEGATHIHIYCHVDDTELKLIWEDDGVGVPDGEKERIFNRGVGKNTGLGLFFTKEILSITDISISEDGVYGEGARFVIHVPGGRFRRNNPE
ncbi:PAS domain S-box protein [Methanocalculus taiwanensis]|uniref:histidine kinase n=1 Tax=Methanocalculus taiwanensis TaxID=106207 RepID=A0ABD4TIU6_9EURY|nr:PAS domain S-box protein [Methanocalculus taiwanensis]MCQ1537412.1 PAS domain S-box protein [Methanocalculus taiwanensis]